MSENLTDKLVLKISGMVREQVIRELVENRRIRLDSAQMETLGKVSAKYIKVEIDYPAIEKNLLKKIPIPRDGKDMIYTEAIRADTIEGVLQLVSEPRDGKDGQDGKAGENYVLKAEDRADIASKVLARVDIPEDIQKAITDEIVRRSVFVSREQFRKEMRGLKTFINQNKGKPGVAGISGNDMIEEISGVLGTDWKDGGAVATAGYIDGFVSKFDTATRIIITAGLSEVDGEMFSLSANTTHTLTSLISAFDHHYVYFDKSASSLIAPVFYDETTEPVFDIAKNGRYHPVNTDDRMIGTVMGTDGAATIIPYLASGRGKSITIETGDGLIPWIALSMNPSGVFQDPNVNPASVVTPVNAIRLRFKISNTDANSKIALYAGANELVTLGGSVVNAPYVEAGYDRQISMSSINLGDSRNIRIGGSNLNDNVLSMRSLGHKYER